MASKFTAETVHEVLKEGLNDDTQVSSLMEKMRRLEDRRLAEQEAEKEQKPKEKLVYHVVLPPDADETGWVLRIPENMAPGVVDEKIRAAIDAFNCTRRGRKDPVKMIGDGLERVPARFFKEQGIKVVTKLPTSALPLHSREFATPTTVDIADPRAA